MKTRRRFFAVVASATIVARIGAGPASVEAAGTPILGSGSTFAEVALDAWASDIYVEYGLSVDYSGNGSRGGLQNFQDGIVDFASSDVPYYEADNIRRQFAYNPIDAGG